VNRGGSGLSTISDQQSFGIIGYVIGMNTNGMKKLNK
jgi:hypothetical protein